MWTIWVFGGKGNRGEGKLYLKKAGEILWQEIFALKGDFQKL